MKAPYKLPLAKIVAVTFAISFLASCGPTYRAAIQEGQTAAQDMIRQDGASAISVALVDTKHVIWSQTFGLADRERGLAPADDTMFGIGSISKLFAAISVMKLVERGVVKLDSPLFTYVPEFKMADEGYKKITVRMLINHSAGLPGTEYRNSIIRSAEPQYLNQVLESLATQRLRAPPGYMSVYCNDCFTLVEALVAAKSGKMYSKFVQDEILTPLGMVNTRFSNIALPSGSYAKAYAKGLARPQEYVNLPASGGISSSAKDLARIAIMFSNRGVYGQTRILTEESVAEMAVDQTTNAFNPVHSNTWAYGLGWDTVTQPGLLAVGYDGWAKGGDTTDYGSFLVVSPKAGLGMVVLGTSGFGSEKAKVISERVLLRALAEKKAIPEFPVPLQRVVPPVGSPSPSLFASVAGEYAESGTIMKFRPQADGSSVISINLGEGWTPVGEPLKLRQDGWFTSDQDPLTELKVVNADLLGVQTPYLVKRSPGGFGHYLDLSIYGQRVHGFPSDLSTAWTSRLAQTWLIVNANPDELRWNGPEPRLRLATLPELKGLIMVHPAIYPAFQIIDPSKSDTVATMMLVIPQLNGRDLNDLNIVMHGNEEWVRFGSFVHRPLASVAALQRKSSSVVTIGSQGYSEWRALKSGATPAKFKLTTAGDWILYDPAFKSVANGKGNGVASLPAGNGLGYIALFGNPGATINIEID